VVADARHGDEDVNMDEDGFSRRQFFKRGVDKVASAGVKVIEQHVEAKSRHWIRPPFAKPELDFLLACTRCSECIEACPHDVIFPLPVSRGAEVAATPAMDLLNKGCHLCEDWPCVNACADNALAFFDDIVNAEIDSVDSTSAESDQSLQGDENSDSEKLFPPKLAVVAIDTERCLPYNGPECGACKGSCPVPGALLWRDEKPNIDQDVCVGCALCREVCIVEPKAIVISTR
jgi:ferredoxin-type protein NapG